MEKVGGRGVGGLMAQTRQKTLWPPQTGIMNFKNEFKKKITITC
jgi:hypothetical protein